jgi:hypothetical protein
MAKFDMYHNVKAVRVASPFDQADTTNLVGEVVDTTGFEGVVFLFLTGALNDLVSTILIEQSATSGGTYTAVPDSQLHGLESALTIAADDDNKVAQIGVRNTLPWVRATFVVTTGSGVNLIAAIALLGMPSRAATTPAAFN